MASDRYLKRILRDDAFKSRKMAFVSGPRQVGKTFLAKGLLEDPQNYKSWDQPVFRKLWSKNSLSVFDEIGSGAVVLDEVHKDKRWKSRLKGIYDTIGDRVPILVTGSARLDFYRRGGDSLMGRYLPYRLHPFSTGESSTPPLPDAVFEPSRPSFPWESLMELGGFPEALLGGSASRAQRWSRLRLERLVREEVRDLRAVMDLNALRVLVDLLPERVGAPLSIHSLREDVGVAYATVREWMQVLEALYHCFFIRPWAQSIRRSLSLEPKLYLYDSIQIQNIAVRQENLTALHLLKACDYWTDTAVGDFRLHYIRTKDKKEIDFLVVRDRKPWLLVECKSSELQPSPQLVEFGRALKVARSFQLVSKKGYYKKYVLMGVEVMDYESFFSAWV